MLDLVVGDGHVGGQLGSPAVTTAWVTRGCVAQQGLDLARLDAVAADLDLAVGAAEEAEGARRRPTDAVAGAVQAGRVGANGLGMKRRRVRSSSWW